MAFEDRLRGRRILVVDDDENTRDLLKALLSTAGADIAAAVSIETAIQTLKTFRAELVVTDLFPPMRPSTTFTLLQQACRCPVILHTGRGNLRNDLAVAGFASVLIKPVDPTDILATVTRAFGSSPR